MKSLLLESEYAEIIIELLKEPYNEDSVVKLVFLAFCIKNETRTSYRDRKTDFVDIFLENINIKLLSHPDELQCVFEVINKLRKAGWVKTDNGKIEVLKDLTYYTCDNRFLKNCKNKDINPIMEVKKLDDKAFVEEILRHV